MKAVITDGKGNVKLTEIPEPQPDRYQCLCKIEACATCTGTDQKIVNSQLKSSRKYPAILGHESFGTVIKCGDAVRHIRPGDRFLRPYAAYPGTVLGGYDVMMGGFAEYGLVTDTRAALEDDPAVKINGYCKHQQQIPPGVEIEAADATMLITLKEIASYVRDLGVTFGSKVVVLGTGSVSMAICFFAKLLGAYPVIVIGRRDAPIKDCKKTGADFGFNIQTTNMVEQVKTCTNQAGVDFVLDAAGDNSLFMEAARLLAKYGAIATYAVRTGSEPLELGKIKGPGKWKFIQGGPDETSAHQYLLDLVRIQAVPLKNFYSHVMPLDDFERGFKMMVEKKAFKIVFVMNP